MFELVVNKGITPPFSDYEKKLHRDYLTNNWCFTLKLNEGFVFISTEKYTNLSDNV